MKKAILTVCVSMALTVNAYATLESSTTQISITQVKEALHQAASMESYKNSLTPEDIDLLRNASKKGDLEFTKTVKHFIQANPDKSLSLYIETEEVVSYSQSQILVQEISNFALAEGISLTDIAAGITFTEGGTNVTLIAALGGGIGIAAAVGGGGGGGGGSSSDSGSTPVELGFTGGTLAEYGFTGGYNLSKGAIAHQRGYSGEGTTVAVIDTGIRQTHDQFGAGQIIANYDAIDDIQSIADSTDSTGHGTHVAGIIGAQHNNGANIGYAPNANLINIRITDNAGNMTADDGRLARAFDFARNNGAHVVNNSWGFTVTTDDIDKATFDMLLPNLRDASIALDSANIISVFASGNDGVAKNQPTLLAALPELYPELEDHWLAVTNIDTDGSLNPTSQPCGRAANWCISAPGSYINSGYNNADNGYAAMSGTSMSAPAVSGAVALLREAFPTMSSVQIRDKLLNTADSSGIYADSVVYGHGLMDLDAATMPVGPSSFVLSNGNVISAENSSVELGGAFGASNPMAGVQAMFVDQYNAGYWVDLSNFVSSGNEGVDLEVSQQNMTKSSPKTVKSGKFSSFTFRPISDQDNQYETMVFSQQLHGGNVVRVGYSDDLNDLVQVQVHQFTQAHYSQMGNAFVNPYFSLNGKEQLQGSSYSIRSGANALTFAAVSSDDVLGSFVVKNVDMDKGGFGTEIGYLVEEHTVLGSQTSGAMKLAGATPTAYLGMNGNYAVSSNVKMFASAYAGYTKAQVAKDSLFSSVDGIVSSRFSVGAVRGDLMRQGDALGFVVAQPLRVESGRGTVTVAQGYEGSSFKFNDVSVDLSPEARQINAELFYGTSTKHIDEIKFSMMHVSNPGHSSTASDDATIMASMKTKF